jgi:hypothetical protein
VVGVVVAVDDDVDDADADGTSIGGSAGEAEVAPSRSSSSDATESPVSSFMISSGWGAERADVVSGVEEDEEEEEEEDDEAEEEEDAAARDEVGAKKDVRVGVGACA